MRQTLTIIFAIVTITFLSVVQPIETSAYATKPWKVSNPSFISYKWGASLKNGTIKTGWVNAGNSWRSKTKQNIRFYHDSRSVHFLTRYTVANKNLYGKMVTTYNKKTKRVTKFKGYLNDYSVKKSSVAKSTGAHELGHALGLDHSNRKAIMNTSRDRTKVTTPQTDDLNGVKKIYGLRF